LQDDPPFLDILAGWPNDKLLLRAASSPAKPEGHMPPPASSKLLFDESSRRQAAHDHYHLTKNISKIL
jgi:hypothetical protein